MKFPECMTRRPTDDESRAAARRLLDAGAYDPEADMPVRLRRRPDGGAYIITEPGGLAGLAVVLSAALLDATERAERAEAGLVALLANNERLKGQVDVLTGELGTALALHGRRDLVSTLTPEASEHLADLMHAVGVWSACPCGACVACIELIMEPWAKLSDELGPVPTTGTE